MSKIQELKKLLTYAVKIARSFGFDISVVDVVKCYSEPQRYWHIIEHLYDVIIGIEELYNQKKIDEREYHILLIAAIFHDIVYDPKRKDNEEKSVEYMMSKYNKDIIDHKYAVSDWRIEEDIKKISDVIIGTKTHDAEDGLRKKFNKLDTWILDAQFIDMLDWENKIYNEFKWAGWKKYKKARISFLLSCIKTHTHNVLNIKNLIDYLDKKEPKTGIFYYEIDKLPDIDKFIDNNNKKSNIFDDIIVMIVYNSDNYDKEKIKEYAIKAEYNNEFVALSENSVIPYIRKQSGDITIIREMKYMGSLGQPMSYNIDLFLILSNNYSTIYI